MAAGRAHWKCARRADGGSHECHSFGWCLVFKGKHQAEGKTMRVFVTGAAGALGRHLVPELVAAGHEVTATTRTPGKAAQLREAGARQVVVNGLDRAAEYPSRREGFRAWVRE
jgi:NADPH:quinone reductase-like Zn-dependent oxidoreductase